MKKHILLLSNLIIIFSIVIGFIGVVYKDTRAYQDLAEKHLENILSLSDLNISKNIEDSMTKPVMVSKTMANDEFLKKWLSKEPENFEDHTYLQQLYNYLKAYQEKYDYSTVFCVSTQTGNYYYHDGLNKKISKSDEHDIWYYNFTESGKEYDLEVDTNQANNNKVTVFVNFRIEDGNGKLLGVIGVGLQVNLLEDVIHTYEKDYGLSVYIVNAGGSKNSFTGQTNVFVNEDELMKRTEITDKIQLNKSDTTKMQWFTSEDKRKCLIIRYNDTLGWYLVLEKDTSSIYSVFQKRMESNFIFMLLSLVACILVVTIVFVNFNKRIITKENTDELTGLPNRKLFSKQYPAFIRKNRDKKKTVFMFDIDYFKNINDTHGHIFGNAILEMVGANLQKAISGYGIASRWGGDEFLGVLDVEPEKAKQILEQYMESLSGEHREEDYRISISVGIAEVNTKLSLEQMMKQVDKALYNSKESGRNQISIS